MAATPMKEAMVLCLDVGPSMHRAERQQGRAQGASKLAEAREALSLFVQQKVMDGKKTEQVGLLLFGCDRADHPYVSDGQYPGVVIRNNIDQADINMIRFLEEQVKGEHGASDFIDAIIVAADMIAQHTDKKKYAKRIILVTDAGAKVDTALLESVIQSLNDQEIRLQLLHRVLHSGLDFNDPDSGTVNPATPAIKRENELLLHEMAKKMNEMEIIPMTDALERLSYFRARNVRQTSLFRGPLDIAGEAFQVPVYVYSRTAEATAVRKHSPAHRARPDGPNHQPRFGKTYIDDQSGLPVPIEREITYQNAEDITATVDQSDLVKAYRYGKTLVPFNKIDEEQMSPANQKCLSILGFAKTSEVPMQLMMANTLQVEAQPSDPVAYRALSALIHALYELDRVAIVRYCRTNTRASAVPPTSATWPSKSVAGRQPPKLGVLTPHIRTKYECLLFTSLPFAEDVRLYSFASFHKVALTQTQLDATDAFIHALDLSTAAHDADGEPSEDLKPSSVPNVTIHRLQEAIKARAIHPGKPLNAKFGSLDKVIQRNPMLWNKLGDVGTHFESAFKLKKTATVNVQLPAYTIPQIEKAEKREVQRQWKGTAAAADGSASAAAAGDGDAAPDAKRIKTEDDLDKPAVEMSMRALADSAVSAVGTTDPVGDFQKMVGRRDRDLIQQATDQLSDVVVQLVRNSFGTQSYDKALSCVEAYRKVAVVEEEWAKFNNFMRRLKDTFKGKASHAFWDRLSASKISLVSSAEVIESDVSAAAADQFLREDTPAPVPILAAPVAPEEKDLRRVFRRQLAELE